MCRRDINTKIRFFTILSGDRPISKYTLLTVTYAYQCHKLFGLHLQLDVGEAPRPQW